MSPERDQYQFTIEEIISKAKEIMLREGKHAPVLIVETSNSLVAGQIHNLRPTYGERVELKNFLGQTAALSLSRAEHVDQAILLPAFRGELG